MKKKTKVTKKRPKSDLKVTKKIITPTEKSLLQANEIIGNLRGDSFHNHFHILHDIADTFKGRSINYMEIGVYSGASASFMGCHRKVNKMCLIDIGYPVSPLIAKENVFRFKRKACKFEYIMGNSHSVETISQAKAYMPTVDILFIDGDHTRLGVWNDFLFYASLVTVGGYVVFDDYMDRANSPEVNGAVNEIVKKNATMPNKKNNLVLEYEVIGSLEYDFLNMTNIPDLKSSNLFILKKV